VPDENTPASGELARFVLHDVNDSLGTAMGFIELADSALDHGDVSEARGRLDRAKEAAREGAETVSRFLRRGEAESAESRENVDIADLLQQIATATSPRWSDLAQAQGRSIHVEVRARRHLLVSGWTDRLRAALCNLVFNAIDAMPRGGDIRLEALPAGDRVILEVTDSGVGMTPDVRGRCFEPFFTTKGELGTGLGLAEVRSVVQQHGGTIDVESHVGRGTTVRMVLPAAKRTP
jgi:signal transduction histidine kinase